MKLKSKTKDFVHKLTDPAYHIRYPKLCCFSFVPLCKERWLTTDLIKFFGELVVVTLCFFPKPSIIYQPVCRAKRKHFSLLKERKKEDFETCSVSPTTLGSHVRGHASRRLLFHQLFLRSVESHRPGNAGQGQTKISLVGCF